MTPKAMVKEAKKRGWTEVSQKGSHLKMFHPIYGTIVIPMHNGDLPTGLEHNLKKKMNWK